MTPRERIAAACAHTEPDRLPVDFGGGFQTGIHVSMVYKLRQALGPGPARHAGQGGRDLPDARRDRARPGRGARRGHGEPARHRDDVRLPADGVQGMAAGRRHAGAGAGGLQHGRTSRTATCSSGPRTTARVAAERADAGGRPLLRRDRPPGADRRVDASTRPTTPRSSRPSATMSSRTTARWPSACATTTDRALFCSFGGLTFGDIALVPGASHEAPARASATSRSGTSAR